MAYRGRVNDTDDLLAELNKFLDEPSTSHQSQASTSFDYLSTPTPRRTQQPLFLPSSQSTPPPLPPVRPARQQTQQSEAPQHLPPPSPSIPLTADQLAYLPQAQAKDNPDESSQYGDDMWEDDQALLMASQLEERYTSGASKQPIAPPIVPQRGLGMDIDEPVVTPQMIQQRVKSELETTNAKGQMELSIKVIDEKFRPLFPYKTFNAMQSVALETAHRTSENFVLSAPTSAGKTTVFELAFLRMVKEWEGYPDQRLAIYIAPTKALCYERAMDWAKRLPDVNPNLQCIQLTGDTSRNDDTFKMLKNASLVVTTPEKWDSVTRRSSDSQKILDRVSLVMIDEVHILCESRGATLEVVVSRMKALGRQIRFVAVSASVPNIDDVARWLASPPEEEAELGVYQGGGEEEEGTGENNFAKSKVDEIKSPIMAKVLKFGEDYRPVPLKKIVRGYEASNNWALGPQLDKALFPELLNLQSIEEHKGKPILVFCPTRKVCQTTAEYMHEMYDKQVTSRGLLPWKQPPRNRDEVERLSDLILNKWAENGIAAHHAGLEVSDRHLIEKWFKEGRLKMIICTSTLAVGVNLPAHTVVIKGTMTWSGPITGFREYSDIEVQQMMGRAGRPQYDNSGVVLLMCEKSKESKYRDMVNSKTILESRLHDHLTEHINSEIGRKTIVDLKSAQEWLRNSFLFVRIKQNPEHYAIPDVEADSNGRTIKAWDQWLKWFVEEALDKLEAHELVTHDCGKNAEESRLRKDLEITQFGSVMSKHCISYGTMCAILAIPDTYTLRELLQVLCGATEFADLRARPGETAMLNDVRKIDKLRFKLEDQVKTYADKVFIHLQLQFVGTTMDEFAKDKTKTENASSRQILGAIAQSAPRIANAIFSVCTLRDFGETSKHALELLHTVEGMAWENDAAIFRQLESIGPKSIGLLASHRITTFKALRDTPAAKINALLNRQGLFGEQLHTQIDKLPQYAVEIHEEDVIKPDMGQNPTIKINILIKCLSLEEGQAKAAEKGKGKKKKALKWAQFWAKNLTLLVLRSDGKLVANMTMPARKLDAKTSSVGISAEFSSPAQTLTAYIGCNEISGMQSSTLFDPQLPNEFFPPEPERPAGQDGDDESALAAENSIRLSNGNFPCAHQCKDKSICNHVCCKDGVKRQGKAATTGQKHSTIRTALEIAAEQDDKIREKKKKQFVKPKVQAEIDDAEEVSIDVVKTKPVLTGDKSKHFQPKDKARDDDTQSTLDDESQQMEVMKQVKGASEDVNDDDWGDIRRAKLLRPKKGKKRSHLDDDDDYIQAIEPVNKARKIRTTLSEELRIGLVNDDDEDYTYVPKKKSKPSPSSSSDVDPMKVINDLAKTGLVSKAEIEAMKAKLLDKEDSTVTSMSTKREDAFQNTQKPKNFRPDDHSVGASIHKMDVDDTQEEPVKGGPMKSDDWTAMLDMDDEEFLGGKTKRISGDGKPGENASTKSEPIVDEFELFFGKGSIG